MLKELMDENKYVNLHGYQIIIIIKCHMPKENKIRASQKNQGATYVT